jgi:hypothetical protein
MIGRSIAISGVGVVYVDRSRDSCWVVSCFKHELKVSEG